MISKISNDNQVSFLFMLILFCVYVVSYFIASGFYEDIITALFDFMITLFIFLKLKETRNLKTYWIYILLGLTCWVIADTMLMLYGKVDFLKQFLSKVNFIQISYVVSYFMFAFSAFYILIKNLKNLFLMQVFVDSVSISAIYFSFMWFMIFNRNLTQVLSQKDFFIVMKNL